MLSPNEAKKIELSLANEPYVEPASTDTRTNLMPANEHEMYIKRRIQDVLDGDQKKFDDNEMELGKIYEYALSKGAETPEDIMWEVRYLAGKLGSPGLGESRVKWLHQYVHLLNEGKEVNRKLDMMEEVSG